MAKVGIVGVGAIGGWIAARLGAAGLPVACLARGATLLAIREHGLTLTQDGEQLITHPAISDNANDLGQQDILILAVKAHGIAAAVRAAAPMIGPQTTIVPMVNGVPWWFLDGTGQPPLRSVDPDNAIRGSLSSAMVVGCVVHASCRVGDPRQIIVDAVDRLTIGAALPAGEPLVSPVAEILRQANLPVTVSGTIREDIWYKLWGNMTINPLSALTRATSDAILDDPFVARFALDVMGEAAEIGRHLGITITESGEARQAVTRRLGAFKTSMLQDLEAGRKMEIAALIEAPKEIAERFGVATPSLDTIIGLLRLLTRSCVRYD